MQLALLATVLFEQVSRELSKGQIKYCITSKKIEGNCSLSAVYAIDSMVNTLTFSTHVYDQYN